MNLLPCPFCGGEALGIDHPPHKHHFVPLPDHPGSYSVECVKCGIGLIQPTQSEAEATWNKRHAYVGEGIPEGWKLVPLKPTPEMWRAAWAKMPRDVGYDGRRAWATEAYDAMLAAAPSKCESSGAK